MSRSSQRGFTLIEVMAAAAMLVLFVAAISEMLMQARRNEGNARRQAQAAALADSAVAQLLETIAQGTAPPLGEREGGEDPWVVTTRVSAFDPAALLSQSQSSGKPPGGIPARAPDAPPAGSWLASPNAKAEPPLLEIEVRVSWDGAPVDRETQQAFAIRRRTIALNPAALKKLDEETRAAETQSEPPSDRGAK